MKTKTSIALLAFIAVITGACGSGGAPAVKEFESHRVNDLVVSLLNEKGELAQGQNSFIVAFHSSATNKAVDAGRVTVEPSMAMPGMAPMTAPVELTPTGETGRYAAKGDFAMSGSWRFAVRWEGPAGQGSTSFNSNVR